MKQVLIAAILTLASFGAKAQLTLDINNNNGCEFEIRAICIDEATCSHTAASTWVTIPAGPAPAFITHPGCIGTSVMGFEIKYAASTGCTGTINISTNSASPCGLYPNPHNSLGACSCSQNPNGPSFDIRPGVNWHLEIQQ